MSEKLCVFCRHCEMVHDKHWSDTSGEWGSEGFDCAKGHFDTYGKGAISELLHMDDVRSLILQAETCPDYKPAGPEKDKTNTR